MSTVTKTVAVSGLNNFDNPAGGAAVIEALTDSPEFQGRIIAIVSDLYETAMYQREKVDAVHFVPDPFADRAGYWEKLQAAFAEEGVDAYIPCRCEELPGFAHGAPDGLPVPLTPPADVFQFSTVQALMGFCNVWSIPHPEWAPLDRGGEELFPEDDALYPFEVVASNGLAFKVVDQLDAKVRARKMGADHGWPLLTRRLPQGGQYSVAAVMGHKGEVLASAAVKHMYTEKNASLWSAVTVDLPDLHRVTAKLLGKLGWVGPAEVFFHVDQDERPRVLSLSPVLPSWTALAEAAGANLPLVIIAALGGEVPEETISAAPGKLLMRCTDDIVWSMDEFGALQTAGKAQF